MSEKSEQIVQFLETHIRIVAFVVALGLLGGVYQVATSSGTAPPVDPGETVYTPPGPPPEEEAIKRIDEIIGKSKRKLMIEQSDFRNLVTSDMFSVPAVRTSSQNEQKANQLYNQATSAYARRQYTNAENLCREALKLYPTHLKAKELLDRLTRGR